jgi:hypothetical protein
LLGVQGLEGAPPKEIRDSTAARKANAEIETLKAQLQKDQSANAEIEKLKQSANAEIEKLKQSANEANQSANEANAAIEKLKVQACWTSLNQEDFEAEEDTRRGGTCSELSPPKVLGAVPASQQVSAVLRPSLDFALCSSQR